MKLRFRKVKEIFSMKESAGSMVIPHSAHLKQKMW
nr:MAG TPA: hypothetical protein [Caudoviricetes sp.]